MNNIFFTKFLRLIMKVWSAIAAPPKLSLHLYFRTPQFLGQQKTLQDHLYLNCIIIVVHLSNNAFTFLALLKSYMKLTHTHTHTPHVRHVQWTQIPTFLMHDRTTKNAKRECEVEKENVHTNIWIEESENGANYIYSNVKT